MFNKKILLLSTLVLSGGLVLSGCSSTSPSTNNIDTTPSKEGTSIAVGEGTQSLDTLATAYATSVEKATTEGIIEKTSFTSGANTVTVYDSSISKTNAISYTGSIANASPIDISLTGLQGNLSAFANIKYDDALMQISNDSKGVYTVSSRGTSLDKSKVIITTSNGVITGYEMTDYNGTKVLSTTFQYGGLTAGDKAALEKYSNVELPSVATPDSEGSAQAVPVE